MDLATVNKGTVVFGLVKKQKFLPFVLWLHFKTVGPGLGLIPSYLCVELVFAVALELMITFIKIMFGAPGRRFPNLLYIIQIL